MSFLLLVDMMATPGLGWVLRLLYYTTHYIHICVVLTNATDQGAVNSISRLKWFVEMLVMIYFYPLLHSILGSTVVRYGVGITITNKITIIIIISYNNSTSKKNYIKN